MIDNMIQKPLVIPVFLPHLGCPHKCAFCDQSVITGAGHDYNITEKLKSLVDKFLNYKKENRSTVQIAFYGGNFLGLEKKLILSLLAESAKFIDKGKVDSIRFSTRPDTIDEERLKVIQDFPVSTIEIGVQSMNDRVLAKAKRGHTSRDTINAFRLLKKYGYTIGAQMMVGLPEDNDIISLETGRRIVRLSPDFVRIYPTVVIAGSLLSKWYKNGEYTPMPIDGCVTLVKLLYLMFKKNGIRVIRMGLQASMDLDKDSTILAGPYHPAFGHMVFSEFFLDMAAKLVESGGKANATAIKIRVNPNSISKMRGLKNKNIEILKQRFSIKAVSIVADPSIGIEACAIT